MKKEPLMKEKKSTARLVLDFATVHIYDDEVVICSTIDKNGEPRIKIEENEKRSVISIKAKK